MATNTGASNAACPAYEVMLEDYLNGELNVADAKSAEAHWRSCMGCRAALEQAAGSIRLLRVAGPSEDPGPGFARVVMARIREVERKQTVEKAVFWQPFVSWGWKFAATATLALLCLVTYDARWGHSPQPDVEEARSIISGHDIFGFAPNPGQTPADRDEVLMMVAETGHGN